MSGGATREISFSKAYRKDLPLPTRAEMRRWLDAACPGPCLLAVRFVDNVEGAELNWRYRGREGATNVLTFAYGGDPRVWADIVICVPVVRAECRSLGKSFRNHLAHLLIHAALHARGFEHDTDEAARRMEELETRIMAELGLPPPYGDPARAH